MRKQLKIQLKAKIRQLLLKKLSQFTPQNVEIIRFSYFFREYVSLFNYSNEKRVEIAVYLTIWLS